MRFILSLLFPLLQIHSQSPTYDQTPYQTHINTYSPDVVYPAPPPPHLYSNGNFSISHPSSSGKPTTYNIPPPMITVACDSSGSNSPAFPGAGSGTHDAFPVNVYHSSPSVVDSTPPQFTARQTVDDVQNQHRSKEHTVFKSSHQIAQVNYG